MKEDYFMYLGLFGIVLIILMVRDFFSKKRKNKEGMTNMESTSSEGKDTLASKSKDHLDKLTETHEALGNKVLASNAEYKKNYEQTAVTLHDIINKMMVVKMNSIYPDDEPDVIMGKLGELNTLYSSKNSLNDVVANLGKTK
jgi:hypothetical protein